MAKRKTATTTRRSTSSTKSATEADALRAAADLVLERERIRQKRTRRRERRQRIKREKEQQAAVERMRQSIEVIKWCMALITVIMLTGIILAIWTLNEVNNEVEKVQGYVNDIETEVKMVREAFRHPMETMGKLLGSQLDNRLEMDSKLDALLNRSVDDQ